MEVVKSVETAEPAKSFSTEEKIQRVEDLNKLIDRYRKLSEAKRNLESFKIASDGMSVQIVLRDLSTGTEFKTSHSGVIQVCQADMVNELAARIREVESLIKFD